MLKKSNISRRAKATKALCFVCDKPKECHHYDKSVDAHLCKDCWQIALSIDSYLTLPEFELRHPDPNEFPPNYR